MSDETSNKVGATAEFETRYVRPRAGPTLVVGSKVYRARPDRRLRYNPRAFGIDLFAGEGVDLVVAEGDTRPFAPGTFFSHIDCISVLEHAKNPTEVALLIEGALAPEGTVFVSAPFVWREHSYPDDYWRFTLAGLKRLFSRIDWIAEAYAGVGLSEPGRKLPTTRIDEHLYVARTEACLFGRRKKEPL